MFWPDDVARQRPQLLTNRQVNLLLEVLVVAAAATGLLSWVVPLDSARAVTVVHAVIGLLIVVMAPLKIRGSVRAGFRRRRSTRWVSAGFGLMVVATVMLGLAHATGLWFGVGYWSALWTHTLAGAVVIPLLIWHITTRPVQPSTTDLTRRAVLSTGAATIISAAVVGAQELSVDALGLAGAERVGTGSHDAGSFDPDSMPVVQWLNDSVPADTDAEGWSLAVTGTAVTIAELWAMAGTVTARLDCTGGWFAVQNWDGVPLSAMLSTLLPAGVTGRSITVTSATGYRRRFPLSAADRLHLAVGYDGRQLRSGHGGPVRLVVPDRRGPQWVKWVVRVEVSSVPAWAQSPLPLS